MNAASKKSNQATLWDIPSATSSPALEYGPTPSDKPAGLTIDHAGPEVAPVHPSLKRAKARGLMMIVTSGLTGIPSSASAALQSSLESNLMRQLDSAGSTLFVETWKRRNTPLRRRYWEHTASAPLTGDSGCTSVPTPTVEDKKRDDWTDNALNEAIADGVPVPQTAQRLRSYAQLATIPTQQVSDMTGGGQAKRALLATRPSGAAQSANLNDYAMLATVATPRNEDSQCAGAHRGTADTLHSQANLSTVRAPSASDADRGVHPHPDRKAGQHSLVTEAHLASISTPSARDWKDTSGMSESGVDPITARSVAEAGATRGFWADCDWWYGRDEKYRPIGPGLFPLATRVAARVLRLRGFGDSIVAPVATAFIRAYLEVRGEQ